MSELTLEKKNLRIEEATEAILKVLKKNKSHAMYKRVLFRKAEEVVGKDRRTNGVYKIPTIAHGNKTHEIKEPDFDFIKANWKSISLYCAEQYKKYLVWDRNGIRLGTLEEFEKCQGKKVKISSGIAKSVNKCADLINDRGGKCEYIEVQRLQIAPGD